MDDEISESEISHKDDDYLYDEDLSLKFIIEPP